MSHELTLTQKQHIYMTPNILLNKTKTVHFNLPTLSENYWRRRKYLSFRIGSNHTVHPLTKVSRRWKSVFSLDKSTRERYFHHLAIHFYLRQEIFHWKVALFFIHLNRRIYEIIILDVSCQALWCSMTSSRIYQGSRNWNSTTRKMIVFLTKIDSNNIYMYRGHFKNFNGRKVHMSV